MHRAVAHIHFHIVYVYIYIYIFINVKYDILRCGYGLATPIFSMSDEFLIAACAPNKFPVLKKLFSAWHAHDVSNMPVRSFLLEEHVEAFALEAIWYHMQASEWTFEVQLFLMHALLLRLQSGTDSRHKNLVEITWTDKAGFPSSN